MGLLTYSGANLKYVGESTISVSNTVLSAATVIDRIYTASNPTNTNFIAYNPGLPDFLQGFTTFVPGSRG